MTHTKNPSNIIVYTSTNRQSRPINQFFEEYDVEVIERRVSRSFEPLTEKEVIKILNAAGGFHEILAERTKVYKEKIGPLLHKGEITVNELIQFIIKNPSVLRYPIIIDDKRCEVGYNVETIRAFLPRTVKNRFFKQALEYASHFQDKFYNNNAIGL